MKLQLLKPRGFCAGVERAIQTVKQALALWGPPIYVKHEIVHNKHVVSELQNLGAVFIEELSDVPMGSRIVYSAHGIPPWVRTEARKRNLLEIDATCGLVTKVHSAVKRFAQRGYHIFLIGHKNHVEVIGTAGEAPEHVTVIETVEDVRDLPPQAVGAPLAYLTQTTLSLYDVKEIAEALQDKFPAIETLPSSSICYATTNRQQALGAALDNADLVLVVGDPASSNSNRLKELAERKGVRAFLINGPEEMIPAWFEGVSTLVMTAGASTPESIVSACVLSLRQFGVSSVEEIVHVQENVFFQLPKLLAEK